MSENENKTIPNDKIKSDKKPNVPNLRFKEFCNDWYTVNLESLVEKSKNSFAGGPFGSNLKSDDYTDLGIPIIQLNNITEDYLNFDNRLIFTSEEKADKLISNNAYPGDLIIAKMMPAGRCCIALNSYNRYVLGSDSIRVKLDDNKCNKIFIREQINSLRVKKIIASKTVGSTRQRIGIPELKKLELINTSKQEQNKIGCLFKTLESRIATQSKIIEDLESLKKSISHKIFGDNSLIKKDWKLTKLSDVLIERKTYDVKESRYPHVTLSKDGIYSKSDRYNRDFLVKDEDKNYKITHLNDVCYNPANLKFGVICLNSYGDAIFSPIYVTYEVKDGNDAYFISQYVTNSTFIGHIRKYEQGTVYERMAVSSEDFLKGKIYLPSITIQNKISQIFKLFDKKINLELEILNKLKEQKKYLLSNMFI